MDTLYTRLHHTAPRSDAAIDAERLDAMTTPDPDAVRSTVEWACESLNLLPPLRDTDFLEARDLGIVLFATRTPNPVGV